MNYAISIAVAIAITAGTTAGVMHYETGPSIAVCPAVVLRTSPESDAAVRRMLTPNPAAQAPGKPIDLFR
jgi:hypothetical protein